MNNTKNPAITEAKQYLKTQGFQEHEYIVSLSGPTILPSTNFVDKLKKKPHVKIHLKSMKVSILNFK
jgi:hypothetical protein